MPYCHRAHQSGQADTKRRAKDIESRGCFEAAGKTHGLDTPLLTRASRPKIVYVSGLSGPLLPQNPLEKVGGLRPPPFPMGPAVGGDRLDTKNKRLPARKLYCK